jgi:sulfite exporter TauE/SafE
VTAAIPNTVSPDAVAPVVGHAAPSLPATGVEAGVFLVVGALGGAHCLGMCGPLVSLYADRLGAGDDAGGTLTVRQVRQHALFNLGRAGGYAAVGAALAAVGAVAVGAFDAVVAVGTGVRAVTGVVVGAAIMIAGASYLRGDAGAPIRPPGRLGAAFGRLANAFTARVDALVGDVRIAGLGVGHALLPCPITYPAYLYAFATGDPLRAAFLLSLVGLGTIPTLFAYGTALGSLSVDRRRSLHRVLGAAFLLLGYLPLSHGLLLAGVDLPHPTVPVYQPLG